VIRARLRTQVLEALYRDNPLDLPQGLIDEQVQQLQIDTARRMGIRDVNQLPAREAFLEPARRRVALGLLISHIVQAQAMKPERERVQARLAELVEGQANPDEALRAYAQNPDAMRQIESAALEDQVVEWLVARARVTDKPMTFSELTGFGRAGAEHSHEPHEPQQAQVDAT
jgi:trigger factor